MTHPHVDGEGRERGLPLAPARLFIYTRNMAESIPVEKKRGRPPGKIVPVPIPIRLSVEQVAAVDRYAEAEGTNRSNAVRTALVEHLKAKGYLK